MQSAADNGRCCGRPSRISRLFKLEDRLNHRFAVPCRSVPLGSSPRVASALGAANARHSNRGCLREKERLQIVDLR